MYFITTLIVEMRATYHCRYWTAMSMSNRLNYDSDIPIDNFNVNPQEVTSLSFSRTTEMFICQEKSVFVLYSPFLLGVFSLHAELSSNTHNLFSLLRECNWLVSGGLIVEMILLVSSCDN